MTFLSCEKYNDKDKYTDKDKYKDKYKDKVKVHKILNMCYIFEKQRVQGYQIWHFYHAKNTMTKTNTKTNTKTKTKTKTKSKFIKY